MKSKMLGMPFPQKIIKFAGALSATLFIVACSSSEHSSAPEEMISKGFTITSSAFEHGGEIPANYTCDGGNINPPLEFSNVPEEAVSLVLIMEDPDVPKGIKEDGIWDHWIVFNIPANVPYLMENQQPPGIVGTGTSNKTLYKGPCPPAEHRYYFRLFALDTLLDLEEGVTKDLVLDAMEEHVIEETVLMGRYDRPVNH